MNTGTGTETETETETETGTGIGPLKPESEPILKVQNRSRIQTETDAMSNRIQYFVLNIYFYC